MKTSSHEDVTMFASVSCEEFDPALFGLDPHAFEANPQDHTLYLAHVANCPHIFVVDEP